MSSLLPTQPTNCIIYFVRHGQTHDNAAGCWSSSDSTPLNKQGIQEAEQVHENLKNIEFDKAFTSTTQRTYDTAKIILKKHPLPICTDNSFNEMHIGPLAGMCAPEIIAYFCEQTGYPSPSTQTTLPLLWKKLKGGPIVDPNDCLLDSWRSDTETFERFKLKALATIQQLAKENLGKTLLVVTHSTFIKAAASICTGAPIQAFKNKTGSWICLEFNADGLCRLRTQKGVSVNC